MRKIVIGVFVTVIVFITVALNHIAAFPWYLLLKSDESAMKELYNNQMHKYENYNNKDKKDFPKLSERKEEVNNMDIGGSNMAGLDLMLYKYGMKNGKRAGREEGVQQGMRQGMQQGMQQGMRQGKISAFVEMVKNNLLSINVAAKSLNMSESEFTSLIK